MAGTHTRLSASASEIYINCSGAIHLQDEFPLEPGEDYSEYADEGTAAHEMAARCLEESKDAWELIGEQSKDAPGQEFTAEMADAVQMYLDHCYKILELREDEGRWHTEVRLDNPKIHKDYGGTADRVGHGPHWVHIVDYKHGIGVQKDAVENPQLMYYALGIVWDRPEVHGIAMDIVQPRGFHPDGPIRTASITRDELMLWAELTLLPAMEVAGEQEYTPGPHCHFCPRKLACPTARDFFGSLADAAETKPPAGMTTEELSDYASKIELVQWMVKSIKQEIQRRSENGIPVPGWKLVEGKRDRVWKEGAESQLKEAFGDDAYTDPSLKSPAEVEKLPGGSSYTAKLAYKPQSDKLSVAPESDRRQAVEPKTTKDKFADAVSA